MKKSLPFLAVCGTVIPIVVSCSSLEKSQDEIVIVHDGRPEMCIVVDKNSPEPTREAAAELQKYIFKTTGARLAIQSSAKGKALYVGESEYTRKCGLTKESLQEQEYRIQARDGNLILIGRDQTDAENAKLKGHTFNSNKFFQETGSLYAVNDFLEKFCGVRWYMLTELGEVIQPSKNLILPGNTDIRHIPSVKFRSLFALNRIPASLHVWKWSRPKEPAKDLLPESEILRWGRRMKVGGVPFAANHNPLDYHKRFADKKDWFALGNPQSGNQLCYSNPEVFAQIVKDARAFFDGNASDGWSIGDFFSVMPSDTAAWCICDKCKAQFAPKTHSENFHNGSASYYVWGFISSVAREIQKTHPGKFISCCAYWDYMECPDKLEIPDNVAVLLTKSYADFGNRPLRDYTWENIGKWCKKTPNVYLWDYYLFPELYSCDRFPNLSPYLVAEEVERMKKHRIKGLMCQLDEWYWRSPAMDHLRVYATMKLLDNWDLDIHAMTEEYYRLFYGPAEKPMAQYWKYLDTLYRRKNAGRKTMALDTTNDDWTKICKAEDIKKLEGYIREAQKLAPKDSVYARRVELMKNSGLEVIQSNFQRVSDILKNARKLTAVRTEKAPVMDGTLRDPVWKKAAIADKWIAWLGGDAYLKSNAYLLYDDKNLYVGFECFDAKDYKVTRVCKDKDGQVYLDDSVELFIQPSPESKVFQIVSNTVPVIFDSLSRDKTWNSGAKAYSHVEPGRWTVVLTVPLKNIQEKPVRPGEKWKINFCRNRRGLPGFISEFSHWSGPNGYHNPERFGTLEFK